MFTPDGAYERLPWFESDAAQIAALAVAASSFLVGLIAGLRDRRRRAARFDRVLIATSTMTAAAGASLLLILGLRLTGLVNLVGTGGITWLGAATQVAVFIFVALSGIVTALTTVASIARHIPVRARARRAGMLVSCGALCFTLFLLNWNLVVFR